MRLSHRNDAAAIANIYNQAIVARNATFETAIHTAGQIEAALADRGESFPTMIVERGYRIVGWAASSPHSARACFAGVAEHSVFVERAARGTASGIPR